MKWMERYGKNPLTSFLYKIGHAGGCIKCFFFLYKCSLRRAMSIKSTYATWLIGYDFIIGTWYTRWNQYTRTLSVRNATACAVAVVRNELAQILSGRARSLARRIGLRQVKLFRLSIDNLASANRMARLKPSCGVHTPKRDKLMPLHQRMSREKHRLIAWKNAFTSLTSAPKFGSWKLKASRSCQHPARWGFGIGTHFLPSMATKTASSRKEIWHTSAASLDSHFLITWRKFITKTAPKRSRSTSKRASSSCGRSANGEGLAGQPRSTRKS